MSDKLTEREDDLKKLMADTQSDIESYEKLTDDKSKTKISKTLIVSILAPIIVFILLYVIQPSFVESEDDSGTIERDNRKVLLWTLGVSVIIWICLYLFKYCKSKKSD